MPKLLVIDDEPNIRFSIEQVFDRGDMHVLGAETAEEGLRLASEESPDVILLDIKLGNCSGLEVFGELRRMDPKCLVIFITGFGTTETAIEAMKLGAYDYLVKPLDATQIQKLVDQACQISRLMHVPAIVEEGDRPEEKPDRLIGSGPAMQTVCKQIGRVAPQDVNVLILGESGTGKELVARAIYHHSRRSGAPFLAINCAAIPESLLESELFGHERGAFTGAEQRRIGKFEQCHGGTLLLDEVGDMSPHTQAKILRLLQEQCFERVGGNETISADVRILAATNQNLEQLIEQGRFRRDLLYRLRGVTISLPPLRDRREDIPELAHYFLYRFNRQSGTAVQSISPEAVEILQQYAWPGNVREMQSIIRESLIVSAGPTILPEFLPAELYQAAASEGETEAENPLVPDADFQSLGAFVEGAFATGKSNVYRRVREQFDRVVIVRAMQQAEGNQNRAAEILGISRVTLRGKLRALRMGTRKVVRTESPDRHETDSAD
jgi:two-component system, NtrC family, nitrogen regulation response regulator GlnG